MFDNIAINEILSNLRVERDRMFNYRPQSWERKRHEKQLSKIDQAIAKLREALAV